MTSTVCLLAKNEARAIAEWLAYQFVIGFDRIVVYDNGSTDETARIVQQISLREPGLTYHGWPDKPGQRPQPSAYADAIKHCVTDWIAFFDTDEFFVPKKVRSVNDFLASMPSHASGIAINWLIFGSAGHIEAGDELVMDRFTRCAAPNQYRTKICKSFVFAKDVRQMHVHAATLSRGIYVNSLGQEIQIENNSKTPEICFEGAQLNHYLLKSREEFLIKKSRGHASRALDEKDKFTHMDDDYWSRNDLNGAEDLSILPWRTATCAKLAEWGISTAKRGKAVDAATSIGSETPSPDPVDAGETTEAATGPAALPGNVEIATENYGVTRYHVDDDCLIVVFASAGIDGLGEPIEEFKTSLKGFGMSTMFVIEKKPTWYNHEDTFKVLGDVGAIAQRYSRIAVLGESMGGAGALNFSRFCPGVDRILSLAPQYSVAAPYINFDAGQAPHGRLAQNFWSFAAPEARAKAQILYGNTDWKDAVHAGMYLVEGFSVHFVDGAGHGVAQYLKRSDRLRPLLASFLDFSQAFSGSSVRDAIGTTLYSKLGISPPHRFADYAEQQHRRKQARENPVRPAAPAGYSDLARGCKTDQSSLSKWSRGKTTEEDSAGAVAGRLTGKYAFHTDLEDRPWWRVDFARTVNIVEVRLYNRIDAHRASTRCLRFAIETAAASGDWREVFRKDDDVWFGGADGKPFTWRPEVALPANQLRIRLLGRDYLHFDAVEVFGA